jgi:hypothetical protein
MAYCKVLVQHLPEDTGKPPSTRPLIRESEHGLVRNRRANHPIVTCSWYGCMSTLCVVLPCLGKDLAMGR